MQSLSMKLPKVELTKKVFFLPYAYARHLSELGESKEKISLLVD